MWNKRTPSISPPGGGAPLMARRLALLTMLSIILPLCTATLTATDSAAASQYRLMSSVMSGGGAPGVSEHFKGNATLGQPTPIGSAASATKGLSAGFWFVSRTSVSVPGEPSDGPLINFLSGNAPNPFFHTTAIAYSLATQTHVTLALFSVTGQRIRTLVNQVEAAGRHRVVWDGAGQSGGKVTPGVYFYRLHTDTFNAVKKLIVLR
jgi:hypothetical protein